jgi:TonB family protein
VRSRLLRFSSSLLFLIAVTPGPFAGSADTPAPAATTFGNPQGYLSLGIRARSVALSDGVHVIVDLTIKNEGKKSIEVSSLSDIRLHLLDESGNEVTRSSTCVEPRADSPIFAFSLAPDSSMVDSSVVDLACYGIKAGHEFTLAVRAREASLDLESNVLRGAVPDTLAIVACANPDRNARAVAVDPLRYPDFARMQGQTGLALIAVSLDERGSVQNVAVYKSSGASSLDESALTSARKSTYEPGLHSCLPVPGTYLFRAEFIAR